MESATGPSTIQCSHVADDVGDEFVTPHQLCDSCQLVVGDLEAYAEQVSIHGRDTPEKETDHCYKLARLFSSARRGCHLCSILASSWEFDAGRKIANLTDLMIMRNERFIAVLGWPGRYPPRQTWFSLSLRHVASSEYDGPKLPWYKEPSTMLKCYPKSVPSSSDPKLDMSPLETEPHSPEEAKYRWCTSTGSHSACRMLEKWLKRCLSEHQLCAIGRAIDVMPTRLLHLCPFDSSQDVRVIDGETVNDSYAALSYCWGGLNPITLRSTNYNDCFERIPWETLPKTMQEAIIICRRLSIRFLWIDALCIIQGEDGDFQKEAERMQLVYSGAICTIAAANSSNPHGGCFRDRLSLGYNNCRISEDDSQIMLATGKKPCSSGVLPQSCLLNGRGWVLQESMLSPRTLYFDQGDIHWVCREVMSCESHTHNDNLSPKSDYLELIALRPRDKSLQAFRKLWTSTLRTYSKTTLSHEDDRLSAITGIVTVPLRTLGLRNSFGLWLNLLLEELCWYAIGAPTSSQLQFLPTWSWLSLNDCTLTHLDDEPRDSKLQKTLHSAKISTKPTETPLVQLSKLFQYSPVLKLKARFVKCWTSKRTWSYRRETSGMPSMVWDGLNLDSFVGISWVLHPKQSGAVEKLSDTTWPARKMKFHPDLPQSMTEGQEVYCVLLRRETWMDKFPILHVWDFCLVLKEIDNTEDERFKRVGVYYENVWPGDPEEGQCEDWVGDESEELVARLQNEMFMFLLDSPEKEFTIY